MLTKSQLMNGVRTGRAREIFSHTINGHFDVTAMREWARKNNYPVTECDLTPGLVEAIRETRDIDVDRVLALTPDEMEDDPAMCVEYPKEDENGMEHLLIDGTHRIVRRFHGGKTTFKCWILKPEHIIRPDFEGRVTLEWGSFQIGQDCQIYDDNRDKTQSEEGK